jgi:hypothetical protein
MTDDLTLISLAIQLRRQREADAPLPRRERLQTAVRLRRIAAVRELL